MKLVYEDEVQGELIDEAKCLKLCFCDSHRPMKDLGLFQEVIVKSQHLSRH
jgi:hypothetical protein